MFTDNKCLVSKSENECICRVFSDGSWMKVFSIDWFNPKKLKKDCLMTDTYAKVHIFLPDYTGAVSPTMKTIYMVNDALHFEFYMDCCSPRYSCIEKFLMGEKYSIDCTVFGNYLESIYVLPKKQKITC